MILFSLAAHENFESLIDTLLNLHKHNPESIVVLHLEKKFSKNVSVDLLKKYDWIYINDESMYTGYMDQSLFFVHYSNLKYIKKLNVNYSFFCMYASNQMFIKSGLELYLNSFESFPLPEVKVGDIQLFRNRYDKLLYNYFSLTSTKILKSPPEGTFYSYRQVEKLLGNLFISEYFEKYSPYFRNYFLFRIRTFLTKLGHILVRQKLGFLNNLIPNFITRFTYASEEIIFPTLMYSGSVSMPLNVFCYMDWNNDLYLSKEDIREQLENNSIYSVKRVVRQIDDPIRLYINSNC